MKKEYDFSKAKKNPYINIRHQPLPINLGANDRPSFLWDFVFGVSLNFTELHSISLNSIKPLIAFLLPHAHKSRFGSYSARLMSHNVP
jgi:hypothetical protein